MFEKYDTKKLRMIYMKIQKGEVYKPICGPIGQVLPTQGLSYVCLLFELENVKI